MPYNSLDLPLTYYIDKLIIILPLVLILTMLLIKIINNPSKITSKFIISHGRLYSIFIIIVILILSLLYLYLVFDINLKFPIITICISIYVILYYFYFIRVDNLKRNCKIFRKLVIILIFLLVKHRTPLQAAGHVRDVHQLFEF